MSDTTPRQPHGDFDERLRAWGTQEPVTDPARAARRVLAALPTRPAPRPWLQLAAVATVLLVVILGALLGIPHTPTQQLRTAQADAPALVDERVVQFWIDPQTPVYFVLSPLGSSQGGDL